MKTALQSRPGPALRRTFKWLRTHIVTIWLISLPPLLAAIAIRQHDEIAHVLTTLRGAEPGWLVLGVVIQALVVLSPVLTYRVILSRLGHDLAFTSLTGMHMQRIVIGTLAPVSGPVSAYAFVRALNQRAVPTHDALTMLALRSVATQVAFFSLLLSAIALRGPVYALAVGGAVLAFLVVAAPLVRRARVPGCIGPWSWRRRLPRSLSCKVIAFAARFRRHRITPGDLSRPVLITVSTRFAGILLLIVSMAAMGIDVAPKTIAMVVLAEIAAKVAMPFFHSIGAVEVATALVLQQSGVPAEAAVSAVLLWRGLEFWLPFGAALLSQSVLFVGARFPVLTSMDRRLAEWGGAFLGACVSLISLISLRRATSGASEAS